VSFDKTEVTSPGDDVGIAVFEAPATMVVMAEPSNPYETLVTIPSPDSVVEVTLKDGSTAFVEIENPSEPSEVADTIRRPEASISPEADDEIKPSEASIVTGSPSGTNKVAELLSLEGMTSVGVGRPSEPVKNEVTTPVADIVPDPDTEERDDTAVTTPF